MTRALSIMIILMIAVSAQAGKVSDYVVHQHIAGSSKSEGKWDDDYIQLIPRAGHPLSAGDLKINDQLRKTARDGRCLAYDNALSHYSKFNQTTKVTFVSDRLLAVSISYDATCAGAAHSSSGVSSTIYDRKLGKAIDISTGFPVKKDDYSVALPAFNKLVIDKMSKQAAKEKVARGDHDCDETYETSNLTFYLDGIALSSQSISVDLSTAHANQVCGFTTVIPIAEFLAVAPKGSILEELAKAASKKYSN